MLDKLDKDKLRLILKLTPKVLLVLLAAAFIGFTLFATRFCYDFFRNGLFGDGSTPGFVGQVLHIPDPTEPPETEGPAQIGVVSRATITMAGDVMMHMPVINSGRESDGSYDYSASFAKISDYVSRSDYAAVDLETTLGGTDNGREYSGYPNFNCPDQIADAVKGAGFDLLLTANDHANDTGAAGLRRTVETIKNAGLNVLGTRENAEEPGWQILDIDGIRIGMIAYTYGDLSATGGRPSVGGFPLDDSVSSLINIFDPTMLDTFYSQMEAKIAAMKEAGAEAIVLFIHWGGEYQFSVSDSQKVIAQKMCDLGVDVIAGSHSHVVQPIALLTSSTDPAHQTVCMYSVGNLLSNQRSDNVGVPSGHTEDGTLFTFSFVKYSNGEVHLDTAELLPIWVQMWKENDQKEYCILPLDASVSDWKTTLGIDDSTLASAKASYDRTNAIISQGLTAVQSALAQSRSDREAAFGIEDGVG